jgi:branched-chain amino acid transport system permease protein
MLGAVLDTLIGGLLTGVLYSLVALGFVLIFKASGVFNFAQGAMVLFAALSLARLSEFMPLVVALALSVAIMIALAYAIEFLVLRHLVNQEGIILFMATLGIAYFLEGFGQTLWGSDIYKISLGLPANPIFILESVFPGGILIDPTELIAAIICGAMVLVLAVFFQVTRVGRALRAVADDHQAAQSVGIPLGQIWFMVWAVAGLVALVAGMMWGAKLGLSRSMHCRCSSSEASPRSRARSSAGSSSAPARSSPRSCSRRFSLAPSISPAAASKTGSLTSWRCSSCSFARRACSANASSSEYDPCFIAKSANSRRPTHPTKRSFRLRWTAGSLSR